MNGAESLLRTLLASNVDVCFMNPGTSEMHFVAALDRVPGMRGILCLFEGVCSGAADGYARMTGRPAATLLHLGPGLANGLANFHNARKARSPIVSIVGEHSTQHLAHDAPLTADIEAFARTVSADVRYLRCAQDIGAATAETVAAARRPPGQIATLIVPADFSWSDSGTAAPAISPSTRRIVDRQCVREAARLLSSNAKVGLMLSGTALAGEGLYAAQSLGLKTGARVFANRNAARLRCGRGIVSPQRIPYFPEPAIELLKDLEHLILVESAAPVSFFGYPGRRSYLPPDGCEVHVLASLEEDGTTALKDLVEECDAEPWASSVGAATPELPRGEPLTPDSLGRALSALLPEGAIISDEMVSSGEPVWHHLLQAAPHDHLPVTGGSIGQGLPVALGAAIAFPDRKVVALEADGSGMYTLQALWTMAREQTDVLTVVFANRRYRILDIEMQRTGAEGFGRIADDMIDIGRPDLDWCELAEGMGVPATRASTADDFIDQFALGIRESGPRLIEAVLPPR